MKALILLAVLCTAQNIYGQDDPLDDSFYDSDSLSSIQRIEKAVEKGVKIIEEGVEKTSSIKEIEVEQIRIKEGQKYIERGLMRNSSRIDKHAEFIKQMSVNLKGTTEALTGLKERWNWWYTVLSSILTGVAGASVTWFLKGRKN